MLSPARHGRAFLPPPRGRRHPAGPAPNDDALAATIDAIYDVATAPEHWPALLRRIGDDLGCHFGGMVATNRDRSRYTGLAVGVERAAHQAFLRRFHQANLICRRTAPRRRRDHRERRDHPRAVGDGDVPAGRSSGPTTWGRRSA